MSIRATIMDTATGKPIQKHDFGRMPFIGTAFHLQSGERVTAQRVDVGKPAPGKFITPGRCVDYAKGSTGCRRRDGYHETFGARLCGCTARLGERTALILRLVWPHGHAVSASPWRLPA